MSRDGYGADDDPPSCKGAWSLGTACGHCPKCLALAPAYIAALQAELRAEKERGKRDVESILNSWRRALGNKLFNKRHLIDALVMTTQHLQANYDKWEAEMKRSQEERETREMARTLGVDPEPYIQQPSGS